MGDGQAEGLLAIGYGRQAAVSLMPEVYGTSSGSMLNQVHIHIFGSSHLEGSYVGDYCIGTVAPVCVGLY